MLPLHSARLFRVSAGDCGLGSGESRPWCLEGMGQQETGDQSYTPTSVMSHTSLPLSGSLSPAVSPGVMLPSHL